MKKQSQLHRWNAGFFDGEGSIGHKIHQSDEYDIGWAVRPQCRINHTYHAGLFDAEGHIRAGARSEPTSEIGYTIEPSCRIGHAQTDTELVEHLTAFADNIGVTYTVHRQDRDGKHADVFTFRVGKQESVRRYLEELYPHLVLKKPQAKIMLEHILPKMAERKHTTRRGLLEIMKWIDKMNAYKGGDRGNYTLEYFEEKWGMTLD